MSRLEASPPDDEGSSSFGSRLRKRVLDPTVLAGPPVAVVLCLFRLAGLVAPIPYWLIVTFVLGAQAVSIVLAALWTGEPQGWRRSAYVGGIMGVIGVVAYSTGWGPILSLGFIFGAAYVLQLSGSDAARPAMVWTVLYMGLGELAIALGIAPSLIRKPLVHGLAGLGLFGVLLTITLLGRSAAAREKVEGELRHSERRFRALVRDSSDIIVVVGIDGRARYVSPAFERILEISPTDLGDSMAFELMHPDDLVRMRAEAASMADNEFNGWQTELRMQHADGTWRWFEATVTNRLEDPNVRGIVAKLRDISGRRQAEEALRQAHERFRSAFDNAPIGMAMTDLDGHVLSANPAMARIVGRRTDELPGMSLHDLTHVDDRAAGAAEMRRLLADGSEGYRIEKRYCHADGHEVWVSVSVSCVRDEDGHPSYLIAQVEDVTERRALRERLAYAAIHDPLTALPNRVLFMDRLETALSRAARTGGQVAVVFLDLDRFKLVNDGMGHGAGDQLLEMVADRLQRVMRPSDTVARFGGDEFVILCDEIAGEAAAVELAGRLADALCLAFTLTEGEIFVTASLGVALSGGDRDTAASLLRDADTAMYNAKERGRARIEVFDPKSHDVVLDKIHIRSELHGALERGELRVYYQPIVELSTGRVACVESLLRWQHPERGLLHPGEFLAMAEESGLIAPIGAWVLEESCRQAVAWTRRATACGVGRRRRQCECQPVAPAAHRSGPRRRGCRHRGRGGNRPRDGLARDHRRCSGRRHGVDPGRAATSPEPRYPARHRRLRNGLCIARLPEELPGRGAQDRPQFHGRARAWSRGRHHRPIGDRLGRVTGPRLRRRRGRAAHPTRGAAHPRVHVRPGIPPGCAAPRRRPRRSAGRRPEPVDGGGIRPPGGVGRFHLSRPCRA